VLTQNAAQQKAALLTPSVSKAAFIATSAGLIRGTAFRALYRTVCDIHRIGGTFGLKSVQEVS